MLKIKKKLVLLLIVLPILIAGGLWGLYSSVKRPELSPVAKGESLAASSGCFACHGTSELETRRNFRETSSGEMRARSLDSIWEDGLKEAKIVKEWIRDGVPASRAKRHRKLLIQMPAYGEGHLSEEEIEAVASWVLAGAIRLSDGMGNGELPMPATAHEEVAKLEESKLLVLGDRLSRKFACYQCHGELGQGNPGNLSSFKGYIPGFFGNDFRELTDGGSEEEILHWINHGRGNAIEEGLLGSIAKHYFERQAIDMPAYESLLSESEKAILVRYMLMLNEIGPLDTAGLERIAGILLDAVEGSEN